MEGWKLLVVLVFVGLLGISTANPQEDAAEACSGHIGSSSSPKVLTDLSGTIESLGYPDSVNPSTYCYYAIQPPDIADGHAIYFEVESFYTYAYDDLRFYYGSSFDESTLLFELNGDSVSDGTILTTHSREMFLYFYGSSGGDGKFKIRWFPDELSPTQLQNQIACGLDRPIELTSSTGIIETQNYPDGYPLNKCEWYIHPEEAGVYLTILDWYSFNYLYVFEHDDADDPSKSLATWYGSSGSTGTTVFSSGNQLFLFFDPSASSVNDYKFQLVWYPQEPACDGRAAQVINIPDSGDETTGTITSPGYPYTVPESLTCRWLLKSLAGNRVLVKALDLHLNPSSNCEEEYVEVLDGATADAVSFGKFCGNQTFGTIPSSSDSLQIYFKSSPNDGGRKTGTGFSIAYKGL